MLSTIPATSLQNLSFDVYRRALVYTTHPIIHKQCVVVEAGPKIKQSELLTVTAKEDVLILFH